MRLWYPTNDTPLFSYPAISIRSFKWEQMSEFGRAIHRVLSTIVGAILIYLFLVGSTHHLITWADFNLTVLWRLLGCAFIAALFPLIVMPAMLAFRQAHPTSEPVSLFYREWASAFTGTGKGGGGRIAFFAEEAERFRIEPSTFRSAPVKIVMVTFRKRNFFKRGDEQFVIQTNEERSMEKLIAWARDRGIDVEELPAEKSPTVIDRRYS